MNVLSVQEPKSSLVKLRLIHAAFVVTIPFVAWIALSASACARSEWTLWHWVITGLALYSAFVGFFFPRKLMRRSEETRRKDPANPKAVKQRQAAHVVAWGAADAIGLYGAILQIVLGGSLWQASLFYAVALFLLLLWTPREKNCASSPHLEL